MSIPFSQIYRDHVRGERDPYWRTVELSRAIQAKLNKTYHEQYKVPFKYRALLSNIAYNFRFTKLDPERFPK